MGDILRKPYEISVWEDVLVTENDVTYYKENKIAVIGSDTMDSPNKVYDPILSKKLNGEVVLTFSLKYKYFDPQTQKMVVNPFEGYLINERKVKLNYDGEWYDFIIRTHEESSEEYTWDYTCEDAFVLELSKNGYGVELDDSLGNNQGTATQLAKTVLKDTDWIVDEENSDILKQFIEEPIYVATLGTDLEGIDFINASDDGEPIPNPGSKVFVFYSYVTGEDGDFVQFIQPLEEVDFLPNTYSGMLVQPNLDVFVIVGDTVVGVDDIGNIVATNFRVNTPLYFDDSDGQPKFKADINGVQKDVFIIEELETKYHAYRLVYNQLTTYDPVMERTVDILNVAPEDTAYRYTDYTYSTSDVVLSYVTNGENFEQYADGTPQGWSEFTDTGEGLDFGDIGVSVFPKIDTSINLLDLDKFAQSDGFLRVKFPGLKDTNNKNTIFNSGIEDNTAFVNSIARGQKFVLRWRAGVADSEDVELSGIKALGDNQFGAIVAKYTTELDGERERYVKVIDPNNIILDFNGSETVLNNIINTGTFAEENTKYIVDDVVQTPSSKYVYIAAGDDTGAEYIWNKDEQKYVPKTEDFIDYRYLVAEAQKSVSNKEMSDPTELFGIFVYLRNGADAGKWYFIQDIQLTRYIEDADEIPVTIGNIPTAQSYKTEYYYLKPKDGQTKDDIELYTSLEAFARALNVTPEEITLAYNENSEKVLMITESHSNCFNILQTIAETFECWLKLRVEHDEKGAIALDENNRPIKKVLFKEFSGNDNYVGFRYGINLKAIQRTVESEEIVTKLIVDQVQSEYTDSGIVSIRDAHSNSSGESYIFNFNYYYRNGLMDMESARPKIEGYSLAMKFLNDAINELNKTKADSDLALVKLNSRRVDFTTLIETAEDNINKGKKEFKKATGQDYDEYRQKDITEDSYVLTVDTEVIKYRTYYYYDETAEEYKVVTKPTGDPSAQHWYVKVLDLLQDDKIVEIIGDIYANNMMLNNYSGLLTNAEKEYKDLRFDTYGAEDYSFTVTIVDNKVRINVSDYVIPFKFYYGASEHEVTVNQKVFELNYEDDNRIYDFTIPNDYHIYTVDDEILSNDIIPDTDRIQKFKVKPEESGYSIKKQIDELLERKEQLTKDFYRQFSRFIQEGTWSSNNYLNADMYYLDAMQVSNVSGQPKVSYSIEVAEVSALPGLENYRFDVGDKTWIEDEEFFGWNPTLKAPTREEVIVSEVEWHLDDPANNTVKIQNYKTQFEDLFQRISATVQSAQYNDHAFAKTSAIINPDGTLRQEILINALNATAGLGLKHNLTSDGSVYIEGDNIYIQNLTNTANRVIINSEGIRVSDDGGLSWTTALSGRGINAETIYTGSIDTDTVTIGGTANPAFRWDRYGLSAFKNDEGVYDLKTFVRFDEYGLYGIKNGEDYIASDLDDIKNKAHFGVTWDSFFIKNSYPGGGRVEISSEDDFQIIQTIDSQDYERVKIGALTFDSNGVPTSYGIRITNLDGVNTFVTDDNGDITITGTINALGGNFTDLVTVGKQEGDNPPPWIEIDGRENKRWIQSSDYSDTSGLGWRINSEGDAYFNNITARGAIKTAVFEYAEIQAVGGIFLFRPSSTIDGVVPSGTTDLKIKVKDSRLFEIGDWCKISNYTTENPDPSAGIDLGGLSYVFKVINKDTNTGELTLEGAAAVEEAVGSLNELVGGALVNLGKAPDDEHFDAGAHNYGIGVNSSDNTVNLPARAISLFETIVDEQATTKITYDFKAVLGTLPELTVGQKVSQLYDDFIKDTQGIYTDNIYFGNNNEYIAFYTDKDINPQKHLVIETAGFKLNEGQIIATQGSIALGDPIQDYYKSRDVQVDETKTYYVLVEGTYQEVPNPTGVPKLKDYYEFRNTNAFKVDNLGHLDAQTGWIGGINSYVKLLAEYDETTNTTNHYLDVRLSQLDMVLNRDLYGQEGIINVLELISDQYDFMNLWEGQTVWEYQPSENSPVFKVYAYEDIDLHRNFYYYDENQYLADTYYLSNDTTVDNNETYYNISVVAVAEPEPNPHDEGYYELSGSEYKPTQDTTIVPNKTYYVATFTIVENPSGSPHAQGYYQLIEESWVECDIYVELDYEDIKNDNPSDKGYYEQEEDETTGLVYYKTSFDTVVDPTKTYYTQLPHTELMGLGQSFAFETDSLSQQHKLVISSGFNDADEKVSIHVDPYFVSLISQSDDTQDLELALNYDPDSNTSNIHINSGDETIFAIEDRNNYALDVATGVKMGPLGLFHYKNGLVIGII